MEWIVDRIEDGVAVIETEDGAQWQLPPGWLPADAREGSVLVVDVRVGRDQVEVSLRLDARAQAAREAKLRALRDSIPEGPSGDITL